MKELSDLEGEQVILVMEDERSLKGTIEDFDENWIALTDVDMKTTMDDRGWAEVTINTGEISKRFTEKGVFTEQEGGRLVRLERGLISLDDVMRVWAWEPENVSKPQNVVHAADGENSVPSQRF
jgi:small nuclear ribonucleoprotein (snRNP)-like protein